MRTIETGPRVDDLGVSDKTLAAIILKAKRFDAMVPQSDPNESSNASDDREIDVLEDQADNPSRYELAAAIENTMFNKPTCPVYQNVNALAVSNPDDIKKNLVLQLTGAVRWTQIMENMIKGGATHVIEVGPGRVLQGLFKKLDRSISTSSAEIL